MFLKALAFGFLWRRGRKEYALPIVVAERIGPALFKERNPLAGFQVLTKIGNEVLRRVSRAEVAAFVVEELETRKVATYGRIRSLAMSTGDRRAGRTAAGEFQPVGVADEINSAMRPIHPARPSKQPWR